MNADMPPRRLVLRGVLALGCGLCLPVALTGCDPKPGAGSGSSAPGAAAPPAPPSGATATAAQASGKKATQAGVQYQLKPKGEQNCANCRHFIAESKACHLVDGEISSEAWCIIWAKLA